MNSDSVIVACNISQSLRLKSQGAHMHQDRQGSERRAEEDWREEKGKKRKTGWKDTHTHIYGWPACQAAIFVPTHWFFFTPNSSTNISSTAQIQLWIWAHTDTPVQLYTRSPWCRTCACAHTVHTWTHTHIRITAAAQAHLANTWLRRTGGGITHTLSHRHREKKGGARERERERDNHIKFISSVILHGPQETYGAGLRRTGSDNTNCPVFLVFWSEFSGENIHSQSEDVQNSSKAQADQV